MHTKFIEATNGPRNWGKFMVGRFDEEEWDRLPNVPGQTRAAPLLAAVGWTPDHIVVWDLQTGEGAIFRPGGSAHADLEKHALWVCPLYEPFLEWLYGQSLTDLDALPDHVDLPDAPFEFAGYRRSGMEQKRIEAVVELALACNCGDDRRRGLGVGKHDAYCRVFQSGPVLRALRGECPRDTDGDGNCGRQLCPVCAPGAWVEA